MGVQGVNFPRPSQGFIHAKKGCEDVLYTPCVRDTTGTVAQRLHQETSFSGHFQKCPEHAQEVFLCKTPKAQLRVPLKDHFTLTFLTPYN